MKNKFLLIAFIEGATVMAVELLGARAIVPFYGSSLIMWTTLLSVTLFGLAIGYFFGSWLCEKVSKPNSVILDLFYFAALFIALIPVVAQPFLVLISSLEIILGCTIASMVIVFPSLVCLGATSALIIKVVSIELKDPGKASGLVYSISTLGGIVSTFYLGFVVIPNWGVFNPIIFVSWVLFLATNIVLFNKQKMRTAILFGILFLISYFVMFVDVMYEEDKPYVEIYKTEGLLGQIRIDRLRSPRQEFVVTRLLVNNVSQTIINHDKNLTANWSYIHNLSILSSTKPKGSTVLLCGFGGGSMARELADLGFALDIVEIDGRMEDIAIKHLGYQKRNNFIVDDARHYINTTMKKYDLIVLDLLKGEVQPSNMFSVESFKQIKSRLKVNGMLLVNYQGRTAGDILTFTTIFQTIKQSGLNTTAWSNKISESSGDVVFIGENRDSKLRQDLNILTYKRLNSCCEKYADRVVKSRFLTSDEPDIEVLTDDKPRLEVLNQKIIYEWRKKVIESTLILMDNGLEIIK
ncbi:MAG: fused MFS/spermidine synthase [Flavobacteriales bacterium]|nr:fused MFS/spermidine synthase [Flavobacteriales bacterium]